MTKIVETDHAAALMAVLEEIVAGSHGLVSNWALLTHAQAALERGGLEGLARFYRASVEQPGSRAIWIRATLEAHGRTTLASEYAGTRTPVEPALRLDRLLDGHPEINDVRYDGQKGLYLPPCPLRGG